jgi:hypothetical protein
MKFLKTNYIILIAFIILFIWGTYTCVKINNSEKATKIIHERTVNRCHDENIKNDICEKLLENPEYIPIDTYSMFNSIIDGGELFYLTYIVFIFITVPAVWQISKEFKNNYPKNYLTRKSYKSYLFHIFKSSYKVIWILPVFVIYIFIFSYYISGHFNYISTIEAGISSFEARYLENIGTFVIIYILNLIFISILYINLALIYLKKNKSVIVAIIEAYLTFIVIEIVNEIFISYLLFQKLLNIDLKGNLILFNIFNYYNLTSAFDYLLIIASYTIISFIVVLLVYRNKEKVIVDLEKIN